MALHCEYGVKNYGSYKGLRSACITSVHLVGLKGILIAIYDLNCPVGHKSISLPGPRSEDILVCVSRDIII